MSEVPNFSLFEGEVIVAEGFIDASTAQKFNVTRIHKPAPLQLKSNMSIDEMKHVFFNNYREKPLTFMIAKGPFTMSNNLNYNGLYDFLSVVKQKQP